MGWIEMNYCIELLHCFDCIGLKPKFLLHCFLSLHWVKTQRNKIGRRDATC